MDQKADFSDKQTNMDNGSKNACSQSMDVVTQPPHTNTEIQRSEYHQAQAETASTVVDETFRRLSLKEMDPLDQNRWSPKDLTIFQHPMWLISSKIEKNEAGKETKTLLKIEEEVFDQISKIDWPIVVVAVAGLSKTGKSYLMNRLAKSSKGFEVGDTIERTTKGIWAWCKIHPTQSNTVLLLLDTEGLGDNDKGDPSHDNKIFTLATLLCNCLVYNMKGTFDYDTVSKLTFVTEMASNIRFRGLSSKDNQSINLILPDFVLCLRDFTLKLMKDGKKISENEYLEQSLAEDENKTEQFNKPRACIRNNFPRRECFAFPFPCNIDDLEKLETLSLNDLSARFQEVTTRFTSYIYTIPPKELLGSKPLNGQMFITLADHYVTAIKHGAVPDVDDAFEAVAKMENTKIAKKALKIFETEMEKEKLPVSEGNLWKRYTRAQGKSLHYLRQNAFHDFKAKCEIQAQRKMDTTWNKIKTINEQKIQEECEKTLKNVFEKYLVHNLKNREYETAGGHRRYKRDVERAKGEYVSVLREFKQTEVYENFDIVFLFLFTFIFLVDLLNRLLLNEFRNFFFTFNG
ncbi:guanylate-binding protein 6-like [Ruditapes philippinarum]|uniref:guanylate-binding protein 6-like n=1 Tax=Ruditapes philippinarum TaxID=129788 RepID=UPI00295B50C2|nr:guanylate-binding protein 6-like [Ruditapes philippinarum]